MFISLYEDKLFLLQRKIGDANLLYPLEQKLTLPLEILNNNDNCWNKTQASVASQCFFNIAAFFLELN